MHIEKRNKLFTNYVKDTTLVNEEKNHKNKFTSILRNSERLYYRNELHKAKLDNKKTWKVLNNIICMGKSNPSNIPVTFIESNIKYYEPKAESNCI